MIYKAKECCSAFTGILIDTGILQNRCKHLAGFLQEDVQGIFLGKSIGLLQFFQPGGVLFQGCILGNILALPGGFCQGGQLLCGGQWG